MTSVLTSRLSKQNPSLLSEGKSEKLLEIIFLVNFTIIMTVYSTENALTSEKKDLIEDSVAVEVVCSEDKAVSVINCRNRIKFSSFIF